MRVPRLPRKDVRSCATDASDSTNDGNVDVTDAILLFNYLFLGGTAPAAPGPVSCGPDTGEDDLDCASYNSCD